VRNLKDTCEVTFLNFSPSDGDEIEISVGATVIFGGVVHTRNAEVKGTGSTKAVFWNVVCKSWVAVLEQNAVNESYAIQSDSSILSDIFSNYTTGFDASTYVTQLDNDLDITFVNKTVRGALDQLAERVGATWYIDPEKNLHWFDADFPETAAFNIDTDSPDNSTTFNVLKDSIRYTVDTSNIINQVVINGGAKATQDAETFSFSADSSKDTFGPVDEIIDTLHYVNYTDTDDNSYTVWGSFVGYAPTDKLRKDGGSYNVLVSTDRKRLRVQGNSGQVPKTGTNVEGTYYTKEIINLTVDDTVSQSIYGVYPVSVNDETFDDDEQAQDYAQAILDANSTGRASLDFEILRYGLIPGTVLSFVCSDLGIGDSAFYLLLENGDKLLLEDGDALALEDADLDFNFIVQEISYIPIFVSSNEYVLACRVSCGEYRKDIIDSIAKTGELQSSSVNPIANPTLTRLSDISGNLGEVAVGRATFTDGGTAKFNWGTPNGATGAVIGLEDKDSNAYGAAYIYESGTIKAKLGRLNDLPSLGTITPSGWGIYTTNGYFSGELFGSRIEGGTITGNTITGNTISGELINGGTVSGALVTGSNIIGGTIATSTPPINSSNPGVLMDSTGLYGYGSAGLTFRLSSDPSIKPWFSSGTILNTVYEVNESAVIRTGTTNPRVQIDNSGIFGYNSGGTNTFSFDVDNGWIYAVGGYFTGTVDASTLSGNSIEGGTISGAVFTGGTVTGGTLSAARFTGGTISGAVISGGVFTGGTTTAGTLSASRFTGGTIQASQLISGTITGLAITGNNITGGTVSQVGGSVALNSDGLSITSSTTWNVTLAQAIKFKNTSGSVIGNDYVYRDTSTSPNLITRNRVTGHAGGGPYKGISRDWVWGTTNNIDYSQVVQSPTQVTFVIGDEGAIAPSTYYSFAQGTARFRGNVVPYTNNTYNLGTAGTAFKGVYLYDAGAGNVKLLRINNGTVLIT
jgi:uncharacterized protein YjbI with pentapeptide repeats